MKRRNNSNGIAKRNAKTSTKANAQGEANNSSSNTSLTESDNINLKSNSTGAATRELQLGRRDDVRLLGIYTYRRIGGPLTAKFCNGFLDAKGRKDHITCRLGTTDMQEAQARVLEILERLEREWDQHATAMGTKASSQPPAATMRESLTGECIRMEGSGLSFPVVAGCKHEVQAFLRLAGPLANSAAAAWTPDQFGQVRDKRLAELNRANGASNQAMRNVRFVLGKIEGIPAWAVELFRAPHTLRKPRFARTQAFNAMERKMMFDQLDTASSTEQGILLFGANGSLFLGDLVLARWEHLTDLLNVFHGARIKNDNPFSFVPWEETKNWAAARPHEPRDVYVFPEFIFSEDEFTQNPSVNQVQLTAADESARRSWALARARKCFLEFLRKCGISRPGLSFKSFRHTNISLWEASGVPRHVGMAVTGHTIESTYLAFVQPTDEQLAAVAELTLKLYKGNK